MAPWPPSSIYLIPYTSSLFPRPLIALSSFYLPFLSSPMSFYPPSLLAVFCSTRSHVDIHKRPIQYKTNIRQPSVGFPAVQGCYNGQCSSRGVATGGILVYIPPKSVYLTNFLCGYWLFFLFDPGQIVVDFEIGMTS